MVEDITYSPITGTIVSNKWCLLIPLLQYIITLRIKLRNRTNIVCSTNTMAEEVYRIIPSIRNVVNRELFVHKHTGHSSVYWFDNYVQQGHVVQMVFTSNDKPPSMAICPSWIFSPYEPSSVKGTPTKKYVMLKENGEWYNYKPLTIPQSRWRLQ